MTKAAGLRIAQARDAAASRSGDCRHDRTFGKQMGGLTAAFDSPYPPVSISVDIQPGVSPLRVEIEMLTLSHLFVADPLGHVLVVGPL